MTAEDVLYDAQVYADDDLNEADIVEWYETRPVTVPTAIATGAIIGAFALGVLTAVGALALMGRLDDQAFRLSRKPRILSSTGTGRLESRST